MTVIEFFDRESAIENIAGALLYRPQRVVFLGGNSKRMKKSIAVYREVLNGRDIDAELLYKSVGRNNLNAIVEAIEEIILGDDECGIDLSGGDELFLVAVGIVFEKYRNKVKIHRFNISNNQVVDCDSDGKICRRQPLDLSVDESIRINGGRVIYEDEKPNATFRWDFSEDFVEDIKSMWEVCKKDVRAWNSFTNALAELYNTCCKRDELALSVRSREFSGKIFVIKRHLEMLAKAGIVKNLVTDGRLSFEFKNRQVMKCLMKAGTVLELIITVAGIEAEDEDGTRAYNSVVNGVYIDWDGVIQKDSRSDVENEIDVVMVKGMMPVFVSCKNGTVDTDELYKLSVVAERFGGKFVKKALITTQLNEMGNRAEHIRARAKEMNISLVEDADNMDFETLAECIGKLRKRT